MQRVSKLIQVSPLNFKLKQSKQVVEVIPCLGHHPTRFLRNNAPFSSAIGTLDPITTASLKLKAAHTMQFITTYRRAGLSVRFIRHKKRKGLRAV